MKNVYLAVLAALLASILLIPLIAVASPVNSDIQNSPQLSQTAQVRLKVTETSEIKKIDLADYIFGAVAAYTFYLFRKGENSDKGYDITDSHITDQAYLNGDELKEKWGDAYAANSEKIKSAVASVSGMAVTYQGKPILAAYHAISPGKTQSAADVWGGEYPYLTVVDSIGDLLCPEYLSSVTVNVDELKKALNGKVEFSGEAKNWIGKAVSNSGGGVKTIKICGTALEGSTVRDLLKLRSTSFDVAYSADKGFTFTVRGYGHGVGMSQYGANYMALQGSTYMEILSWYYPGCQLQKI